MLSDLFLEPTEADFDFADAMVDALYSSDRKEVSNG